MPTIEINPRWGAQIEGEAEDIAELEWALTHSSKFQNDFILWRMEGVPILRSLRWDALESAGEVQARAQSALLMLVGAINLLYGSRPLEIGTIYEFKPGGQFEMSRLTTLTILVKQDPEKKPPPAAFREIVELAEDHEWLASSLALLGSDGSWLNSYMTIEAIEAFHGSERAMMDSKLVDGRKLKRAKQMANAMRHLNDQKHQAPSPPMELAEAWALLKTSVKAMVKSLTAAD